MIFQGKCNCSKCQKEWGGARQTLQNRKKWRSPCCNAIGINWMYSQIIWLNESADN